MIIKFPHLQNWQSDVYESVRPAFGTGKMFIVKSKRQVGKSTLANIILITYALEHPGCKSFMVEPSNNQCRNQYLEIQRWLTNNPLVEKFNNSMNEIYFTNGSIIIFKSAEIRERLRGYTATGIVIIDEAAFVPNNIIDNILPWVDVHNCPLLLFSTPMFCQGYFYDWFVSADNNTSYQFDWAKYDTSIFLSPEKLEFYRKQVSELKFRSEYLGQFIEDGGFVFNNINTCIKDNSNDIPIGLGIDWGSGNTGDFTWLTFITKSGKVTRVEYTNDMTSNKQIEWIANMINNTPSLEYISVESNSIGRIYYDNLKIKLNRKSIIHLFNTSNETKREIIEDLITAFLKNEIEIPDDNELIKQLQMYAMQKLPSGKYTYNGIGAHDDGVMSLAIAYNIIKKKLCSPYKNKIRI